MDDLAVGLVGLLQGTAVPKHFTGYSWGFAFAAAARLCFLRALGLVLIVGI